MELWIRSQDKTALTKIDNIGVADNRIVFIPNYYSGRVTLGTYKTNTRALEVLGEIQRTITKQLVNRHKQLDGNYSFEVIDTTIYEMPKE